MEHELAASAISRLRRAASIARAESSRRSVGDVVVRFSLAAGADGVALTWSRHDGMGTREGLYAVTWDELARAGADPLVAALRGALPAVGRPAN